MVKLSDCKYDSDVWHKYPQHRWVFNKLELSLLLGYNAGPGGTAVPHSDEYIVRPIYNLSGMGAGAKRMYISVGDTQVVPPGYFWCEIFSGPHITVDYEWNHTHPYIPQPVFAAQGYRTSTEFYRFNAWQRIEPKKWILPKFVEKFIDVKRFNIEYIGDRIIEIHLRPGVDFPNNSTQVIPVWEDSAEEQHQFMKGRTDWQWQEAYDDADGHLSVARKGFYFR